MNYMKFFLFLFLMFSIGVIKAQSSGDMKSESPFSRDYIKEVDAAKEKLLSLADAIPQDKFTWRPNEGVRSVSEVFMHVVGANYYFLTLVGEKMPEWFKPGMDTTVTNKEEIVKYLKSSYDNLDNYMAALDVNSLDDPVEFFGMKSTKRHLFLILLDHNHEHLGQLIAYSRMNRITPPWSKKQ